MENASITMSSNEQQLLITLHMGGTWSKQKYVATEGSRIEKRLLKIPLTSSLSDLTHTELIDHVKREAGSFGNEKSLFFSTYYQERVQPEALFGSCGRAFSFIETHTLVPWLNPS
ncbi:hypothetical protein Hanom_Chr01g00079971 [Helianthus anomalus]